MPWREAGATVISILEQGQQDLHARTDAAVDCLHREARCLMPGALMLTGAHLLGLTGVVSLSHSVEQVAVMVATLGTLTGTLLLWSVLRPWRIVATSDAALLVVQGLRLKLSCAVSALLVSAGVDILLGLISVSSHWIAIGAQVF